MLISLPIVLQKYNINVNGVIQIGSHWAEEHNIYRELGIKDDSFIKIIYVEPCKDNFNIMVSKVSNYDLSVCEIYDDKDIKIIKCGDTKMFNCACGESEGKFDMFVSNNNQGQSNSLLKPKLHLHQHPEVIFTDLETVKVVKLDNLSFYKHDFNLLVLDTQGAEGLVLKGATETLKYIDIIYTECNSGQTYEGNMEIDEMDEYLKPFGFSRVETYWPSPNWTWGDAVFIKK